MNPNSKYKEQVSKFDGHVLVGFKAMLLVFPFRVPLGYMHTVYTPWLTYCCGSYSFQNIHCTCKYTPCTNLTSRSWGIGQ